MLVLFCAVLFSRPLRYDNHAPLKLTPQDSAALVEKSKALLHDRRYDAALDALLKLHSAYPDNHIYIEQIADAYDHLGRYREEAQYWETYMDRAPTPVTACPQIGLAYWKLGDMGQGPAIKAYERCLSMDPKNADFVFYLAHALEMQGDYPRAADMYQRGLSISPDYPDMQLGLARIWLRTDRIRDAQAAVRRVLDKYPDKVDALLVAGLIYSRQGHYGKAKEYLRRGVKLSPQYADFYLTLARIADDEKDYAEELRQYNRTLELLPNDAQLRARRDALLSRVPR